MDELTSHLSYWGVLGHMASCPVENGQTRCPVYPMSPRVCSW